ncbi:KRAB domain-containing zinc finger protein [Sarotherodon galilaeus]
MSEPPERISYKRYPTDPEEEIPSRTKRRWGQKERIKVAEEELQNVIKECQKEIPDTFPEDRTLLMTNDEECTAGPVQIEVPVDSEGHSAPQSGTN